MLSNSLSTTKSGTLGTLKSNHTIHTCVCRENRDSELLRLSKCTMHVGNSKVSHYNLTNSIVMISAFRLNSIQIADSLRRLASYLKVKD